MPGLAMFRRGELAMLSSFLANQLLSVFARRRNDDGAPAVTSQR